MYINTSDRSKYVTNKTIKPDLTIHQVYTRDIRTVTLTPEYLRMSFTRMRLSSHRLRIGTGRWARLPRDQRLCRCGAVQDERHVLQDCELAHHLRGGNNMTFPDVLRDASDTLQFQAIHDILSFFHNNYS